MSKDTAAEPINCGRCLYGSDVGVPGYDDKGPAYINPECPAHNPDTDPMVARIAELEAAGCRTWKLARHNIGTIDDDIDRYGVYAKGYWENVDGKTTVTGLRVGTGETRVVAKFDDWIIRHPNGTWSVLKADQLCTLCKGDRADPEDPGDYDTAVHMHNPGTRGPCPQCNGTGRQTTT